MKQHYPYIRPSGRPIRKPLWQRIAMWLLTAIFVIAFALLGAIVILEWMVGCGETYIDSKGVRHANECIIIPQPR